MKSAVARKNLVCGQKVLQNIIMLPPIPWKPSPRTHLRTWMMMNFDLILAIQTYILHDNYELMQACNQYKNICMHNKSGVFLKTNVVLEWVGVYRSALRRRCEGGSQESPQFSVMYFMDRPY